MFVKRAKERILRLLRSEDSLICGVSSKRWGLQARFGGGRLRSAPSAISNDSLAQREPTTTNHPFNVSTLLAHY